MSMPVWSWLWTHSSGAQGIILMVRSGILVVGTLGCRKTSTGYVKHLYRHPSCLFHSCRLASRIFSLSRQLAAKSPPTYLLPWYHRPNLKENNISNAQMLPPDHRRDEVRRDNVALGGVVVCIDVDWVLPSLSQSESWRDGGSIP